MFTANHHVLKCSLSTHSMNENVKIVELRKTPGATRAHLI